MEEKKEKPPIDRWKPTKKQTLVEASGKILAIYFDKIFGRPGQDQTYLEKLRSMNEFFINRSACVGIIDTIAKYINYFMVKYDPEDELALGYLNLKTIIERSMVDKEVTVPILDADGNPIVDPIMDIMGIPVIDPKTGEPLVKPRVKKEIRKVPEIDTIDDLPTLTKYIYEHLFTPTICEKIRMLVDDNWIEDVESGNTRYKKSNKTYLENLEFNNHHIIILNRISFGMKLIAPVLYHALSHRNIKLGKDDLTVYNVFSPLFPLFQDDVDMYNKLYVYARTNVSIQQKYNSTIFAQREVFGDDTKTVVDNILKNRVISDIIIKYKFDGSILSLNRTVLKQQLSYVIMQQYNKDIVEISNDRDEEGLSGIDKMEMHRPKIDEGQIIYSEYNIKHSVANIFKEYGHMITEDEVRYYMKRVKPIDTVMQLVRAYWYPYINESIDLENLGDYYWPLMLIMKKRLIADANRDPFTTEVYEDLFLPYVISGNLEGQFKQKTIRKEKELSEIKSSYLYAETMKKFKSINEYDDTFFNNLLSKMSSSRFTYIVYENPEYNGKTIDVPCKTVFTEILSVINDH